MYISQHRIVALLHRHRVFEHRIVTPLHRMMAEKDHSYTRRTLREARIRSSNCQAKLGCEVRIFYFALRIHRDRHRVWLRTRRSFSATAVLRTLPTSSAVDAGTESVVRVLTSCKKPRRVGLSRRARLPRLHPYLEPH